MKLFIREENINTAGSTREKIDSIHFLVNFSSGNIGMKFLKLQRIKAIGAINFRTYSLNSATVQLQSSKNMLEGVLKVLFDCGYRV
ncbi:DNA / pantothenate metabolism flavoprotein [Bacillus sp. 5mfcol3.1]|nr:DNA / pantothenate metabolism flavoprotein [Bacillus sp. 5mfcol3.1]